MGGVSKKVALTHPQNILAGPTWDHSYEMLFSVRVARRRSYRHRSTNRTSVTTGDMVRSQKRDEYVRGDSRSSGRCEDIIEAEARNGRSSPSKRGVRYRHPGVPTLRRVKAGQQSVRSRSMMDAKALRSAAV